MNPPSTKHFLWVQLSFSQYTCHCHKKKLTKKPFNKPLPTKIIHTTLGNFQRRHHPLNQELYTSRSFVSIGCRSSADITCLKVPKVHCAVSWHHLFSHHKRSQIMVQTKTGLKWHVTCVWKVYNLWLGKIWGLHLSGCLWFGCCGSLFPTIPTPFWCRDARDLYSSEKLEFYLKLEGFHIGYFS